MDGASKRPYTISGTERFATSRSQALEAEQTNRGHAEAAAGRVAAVAGAGQDLHEQRCQAGPGMAAGSEVELRAT